MKPYTLAPDRNGEGLHIGIVCARFNDEIGIGIKAGIGRGRNAEDAAYMADIGLEKIREDNNKKWIEIVEKDYED